MQKEIESTPSFNETDLERRENEKTLLSKLRILTSKPQKPLGSTKVFVNKESITIEEYLKEFKHTAKLLNLKQTTEKNQLMIQNKLSFLKHRIEKIISSQKENLRLYQLQFAYYKLLQSRDRKLIDESTQVVTKTVEHLHTEIQKVQFNKKLSQQTIEKLNKEINKLNTKLISLNLAKERELLSSEIISSKLKQKIEKTVENKDKKLQKLIDAQVILSLFLYKKRHANKFLTQMKQIRNSLNELSSEEKLYKAQYLLLKELQSKQLDSIDYFMFTLKEKTSTLYSDFSTSLKVPLFVYDENPISTRDILKSILILFIGFFIAKIYHRQFIKLHERRKDSNTIMIKVIANLGFTVIFIITLLFTITNLGLSIANLAVIAGALSIGIGFALRGIIANYIAGILLISEKNIKMGDFIRVDEVRVGKVIDIGLRSTVIRTIDNTHIIIPNNDLIERDVLNLTYNDRVRRVYIPFKIPYGSDIQKVRTLILEAVNTSNIPLLRDVYGKKPNIWLRKMGDSFIELDLFVWVQGYRASIKSNLLILIHETLLNHNIEMPNPQLDLHLKKNQKERLLNQNILGTLIQNKKSSKE